MPIRRLLLAALCVAALVPSARAADLDVTVTGVTADSGDIRVIVITDPDGLARQDRSLNLKAASAKDGVIITRFLGLSPGRYGVVATHDSHVNHALEKASPTRRGWLSPSRRPRSPCRCIDNHARPGRRPLRQKRLR